MDYTFKLNGHFKGGREGTGEIQTGGYHHDISIGKEMSGPGIGTNPDELLIGSVATCYLMTLGIYLGRRALSYEWLSIETTGIVSDEGGLHFKEIIHSPVIHVNETPGSTLENELFSAMKDAETGCMIAKALKGNVHITIKPEIRIEIPKF